MTSSSLLDRATIRHNLTEFKVRWFAHIEEWKAENRPATESSHDQQFWGDLLDCFGINARDIYLYQRSAKRASTGRTGKIDLFMPGKVIGEAKSLGVNLDDAYNQALDYLLGGTIPNWCCCNLGREPRKLRFYCVINAMCLCCQAVSNTRLTITASGFG